MKEGIRRVQKEDIETLKEVIDSSELFPSELLDDMISDYFTNPASQDIWFTALENNTPVSIGYCAPERLTKGTYNLYAIAVHKDYQGKGIGRVMMNYLENMLCAEGNRILIVETSGKSEFALTRKFYRHCNYVEQATVPEFYDENDDKVIFWKKLR